MIPLPIIILAGALACSLVGNAWLGSNYLDVRDERTAVQGERDQARAAADSCSEATEQLQAIASQRAASAVVAIAAARQAGQARQRRAQDILATPATTPGDDCKSADDRVRNWIKGRGQP